MDAHDAFGRPVEDDADPAPATAAVPVETDAAPAAPDRPRRGLPPWVLWMIVGDAIALVVLLLVFVV